MALVVIDGPTIPHNESLSDGIDCTAGQIVRITVPQEFTDANLTFQVSSDGGMYNDMYDDDGKEITLAAKPDTSIVVTKAWVRAVGFLKIRSGTRDNPVNQTRDKCKFAIAVETGAGAPAAASTQRQRSAP